ncbi:hypothetical protein F993_00070 [Acinetobacter proteolyticus]|uniref:Uncharacterized protein n=1 Tax=Acinetobacter proteolyticus TaxID=1776741 RepID=A0ABN0JJ52_9GAMM|nr:hypothetical protein F993_00070 [Acinetobacter proteolyticus]
MLYVFQEKFPVIKQLPLNHTIYVQVYAYTAYMGNPSYRLTSHRVWNGNYVL